MKPSTLRRSQLSSNPALSLQFSRHASLPPKNNLDRHKKVDCFQSILTEGRKFCGAVKDQPCKTRSSKTHSQSAELKPLAKSSKLIYRKWANEGKILNSTPDKSFHPRQNYLKRKTGHCRKIFKIKTLLAEIQHFWSVLLHDVYLCINRSYSWSQREEVSAPHHVHGCKKGLWCSLPPYTTHLPPSARPNRCNIGTLLRHVNIQNKVWGPCILRGNWSTRLKPGGMILHQRYSRLNATPWLM